ILHDQTARHGARPGDQPLDHRGARWPAVGRIRSQAGCGVLLPSSRGRDIASDMTETEPTVFVVDDDPSVRRSTERLVRSMGFNVQTFASAKEFTERARVESPSCLVLDVHLPGPSGLDLQRELVHAGVHIPIIFITGRGSIPMSVRAMKE